MKRLWIYIILILIIGLLTKCSEEVTPELSPLEYQEIKSVEYGTHPQQKFDIYLPQGRTEAATKVVIMIHGGGWSGGDKNEIQNLVNLMRQEWPEAAIVNMNYRLATATEFKHPAQIEDIASVINYIKSKKEDYHVSNDFALLGNSAGAHLSLLYAYSYDLQHDIKCVSDLYGPSTLHDWSWYSNIIIKTLFENYLGTTWALDEAAYLNASPLEKVNSSSPPTIIFHGTVDIVVPLYQSQWLNAKLQEKGVPHEYYEYILDGHGFNATNNLDCIKKLSCFLKRICKLQ